MTRVRGSAALAAALLLAAAAASRADEAAIQRGEYVFHAAGCDSCHTDRKGNGPPLAGGAAIETEFGTFYGPNITPDPEHGIGRWTDDQFVESLRHGVDARGRYLFPVFPYTAFTYMTDADARDLRAYLATVPPSNTPSKPQEVEFPFSWRFLQLFWRWLNFTPGPFVPDTTQSEEWNRGAYLSTALLHCGECHTPRNMLGGLERDMWMAGNAEGPDGSHIPNITPDPQTGIGNWSVEEIEQYLAIGLDPDGDVAGSLMGEVVEMSSSKLTDADRKAIAVYMKSLKPIRRAVSRRRAH